VSAIVPAHRPTFLCASDPRRDAPLRWSPDGQVVGSARLQEAPNANRAKASISANITAPVNPAKEISQGRSD
jgi:hypothetical protein